MPVAAQVSALTAGDTLLAHFWDLASLEEDAREKAASALVDALVQNQAEYDAESGAEQSEDEEEDAAALGGARGRAVDRALRRCSPLLLYAFKRLCRGLGSSRQGARQGFSLAVTSLLAATQCIAPGEAVTAIEGVLEAVGKGTELRDALLGRIFGYAAVVRSGRTLPADLAGSMAEGLVQAAQKKSFLREVAGAVLLELCQAVDDATLAGLVGGAHPPLAAWLTAPAADASPDALLLALRLWPRLPAAVAEACPLLPAGFAAKKLPAQLFTHPSAAAGSKAVAAAAAAFFSRQHLTSLLPVLRGTTQSHPRLHSVWPTLLALLIPGFTADKEQRGSGAGGMGAARPVAANLEALWFCVVDGDLVLSSHERKYLAFTLFLILLPHLGPEHVALVFTPAFLHCLATNLKKADSHLHSGAKKCMERIAAYCDKAAPDVRIAVALALQRHGGGSLERFAKVAPADKTKPEGASCAADAGPGAAAGPGAGVGGADAEGLQQYVRQLQDTFLQSAGQDAAEGGDGSSQQRQWAIEQLCSVLKQAAAPAGVKQEVLQILAVHALFSINAAAAKKSKDAAIKAAARCLDIPLTHRQLCAARLIALADTLDKQQQQQYYGKSKGKQQQQQADAQPSPQQQPQQEYLGGVAAFVTKLQQSGAAQLATAAEGQEAAAEQAQQAASTLQQTLHRMQARLDAGGGSSSGEQQRVRALAHLLRLVLLHSLADPAAADPSLAVDLEAVYAVAVEGQPALQRAAQEATAQRAGSGSDEDMEGGEEGSEGEGEEQAPPHWHDTLMDVLLSLLARNTAPLPSAPLRDAVDHVFRAFGEDLTPTGMQDMLRVLAKPLDSNAAAADGEDVYASSEEEDKEDEEDEEEVEEEVEEEEEEGAASDEEEEEEVEDEEAASGSEDDDEGEPATAAAAAAAAGGAAAGDSSASEDEGMTDEAMFRMDSKLASYFATLKEGRGGGGAARAARDELLNFKMRVATLLEAFCKRMPASPLLPVAVGPLLSGLAGASRPGGHQALAERLSGLITNKLCSCKAEAAGAGLAAEGAEQQLRRTLYLASRATDKRVAAAAWASYIFLQRAAAGSPAADCRAKGVDSARAALGDLFLKKKTRLQRTQLELLLRRVPGLVPGLMPELLKQAAMARNEYLQLEAFLLLASLLKASGSGAASALGSCGPAAAAAVAAAAGGKFSKPQRQVEAVKVACQLLESGGAGKLAAGKGDWAAARQAVDQALDAAAGNPKLSAGLQRLEGLLDLPSDQGKRGPKQGGKGGAAKKQKV